MSWKNYLTPQQLRNFRRRARFTMCGEPADVFSGPTDPEHLDSRDDVLLITVNRDTHGNAWFEATSYAYADPTDEIRPDYLKLCRKIDRDDARCIIVQELHQWSRMPEGTVTGYTPAEIAAEAERMRDAAAQEYRTAMRRESAREA